MKISVKDSLNSSIGFFFLGQSPCIVHLLSCINFLTKGVIALKTSARSRPIIDEADFPRSFLRVSGEANMIKAP
ncbi:hypothetical protein [Leisingera sp. D0M16]|uniref:hypothetical protein n=1 Tax=Leisingera coralii TaxID=3351347 RepID=UPI003BA2E5CA